MRNTLKRMTRANLHLPLPQRAALAIAGDAHVLARGGAVSAATTSTTRAAAAQRERLQTVAVAAMARSAG